MSETSSEPTSLPDGAAMPSFVARVLPVALFATGALTLVTTLVVSASLPHWYFGFSMDVRSGTAYKVRR